MPTGGRERACRPCATAVGGGKTALADSFFKSEAPLRHQARSFTAPPDRDQAPVLLAEIATVPCPFAPVAADRPLALYGAGNLGLLARDFLKSVGQDFALVVDRNAHRLSEDPGWHGAILQQPDELTEKAKRGTRLAVSLVTAPYVPIEQSLATLGFEDIVPFYDLAESFRHVHPLSNGWFAPALTAEDRENAGKVLALWDDDVSRAHHLQFLAWRRLREEWSFERAPLPDCERFFIPEVTGALGDDEVLLDAGAHHGSVAKAFARQTKDAYKEIIAIEPDPDNRARLVSAMNGNSRVNICDVTLAEAAGEATFHAGLGYASQLSKTGQMRVTTQPIDALGFAPTFVKLHLEGGELAALKGARQTLLANRPIVAATVYHNADGIWRTPLWLMDTLPDYRFLFRAHSWCGTGAVVYALPNERKLTR